jgi:hypothetical protein
MVNQVEDLETSFGSLMGQIEKLHAESARVGLVNHQTVQQLIKEINQLEEQVSALEQQVSEKNTRESLHASLIEDEAYSKLLHDQIHVPETNLKLFYDHLRLSVKPDPFGGVQVSLGSFKLPDLRFTLRYQDSLYVVSECDPLVIGLADLVDQLNADTQSGALARFICRIRSRYTAQYSDEF